MFHRSEGFYFQKIQSVKTFAVSKTSSWSLSEALLVLHSCLGSVPAFPLLAWKCYSISAWLLFLSCKQMILPAVCHMHVALCSSLCARFYFSNLWFPPLWQNSARVCIPKGIKSLLHMSQWVNFFCLGWRQDALAEVEEKYRKAMVSNAQLDNEKSNLMYQVDTLKDSLMELEEMLSESQRGYEDKVKVRRPHSLQHSDERLICRTKAECTCW